MDHFLVLPKSQVDKYQNILCHKSILLILFPAIHTQISHNLQAKFSMSKILNQKIKQQIKRINRISKIKMKTVTHLEIVKVLLVIYQMIFLETKMKVKKNFIVN